MAQHQLATQRLMREKQKITADPSPHMAIATNPENIFEWHFVLFNFEKDSPFHGGYYHGKINIPAEYPLKPPSMQFLSPTGRFKVDQKICLSFTSYHPESWSSSWTIQSMLIAVISFMHTDENTVGGMKTTFNQKQQYARKSLSLNLQNPFFRRLFSDQFERIGINPEIDPIENFPINGSDSQEQGTLVEPLAQNDQNEQQRNRNKKILATVLFSILCLLLIILIVQTI